MLSDFPHRVVVRELRHRAGSVPDIDVVLYDTLCLHRREGEELDQLLATPGLEVLVFSRDMRPDLRARALAKGCSAWVSMSATAEELVEAIELTAAGENPAPRTSQPEQVAALTVREMQILSLITQGYSNNEIAACLGVTANTLKTHVRQIYRKIGVDSRAQAVGIALQHGFVPTLPSEGFEPSSQRGDQERRDSTT